MNSTTMAHPTPVSLPVRRLGVALAVAGLAHVPPTAHHLAEAPAVGLSFVGFTLACLALLAVLPSRPTPAVLMTIATLCGTAVVAYVASRLIPLPGLAHDVGAWRDLFGTTAVAAESIALVIAVRLTRQS